MENIFITFKLFIKRCQNLFLDSSLLKIIVRIGFGYINGNGAMHVYQDITNMHISQCLRVVYLLLMLVTTIHIVSPKIFGINHQKNFKYLRWCNLAIVCVLAIAECISKHAFVQSSIVEAIIEIAIEVGHRAFV